MSGIKKEVDRTTNNILLVGVGGQGTILASKILSDALVETGYDVKMSEVHGMSQRGGNVSTQIRYGKKIYSPTIGIGSADVIVAFEKMEALRWIEYLQPEGKIVINDFEILSTPILMGQAQYPLGITEKLEKKTDILVISAAEIAESLGNARVMNIVLLGALVRAMNIEGIDWSAVIRRNVKKDYVAINIRAFEAGYAI
jgi:indolepyruvate ferredoxin oxidoreductase beta subunit